MCAGISYANTNRNHIVLRAVSFSDARIAASQDALQTLYSWLLLMSMLVSMHLTGTYYQMLLLRYPAEHEVLHHELP